MAQVPSKLIPGGGDFLVADAFNIELDSDKFPNASNVKEALESIGENLSEDFVTKDNLNQLDNKKRANVDHKYNHWKFGEIGSKKALDMIFTPDISVSLNGGINELMGTVVDNVNLSWNIPEGINVTSIVISSNSLESDVNLESAARSYQLTNLGLGTPDETNTISDAEFRITITDNEDRTASDSIRVRFLNRVYYGGINELIRNINQSGIKSLSSNLSRNKNIGPTTINFSDQSRGYVTFAYPSRFGLPDKFTLNTFNELPFNNNDDETPDYRMLNVENSTGYTEEYILCQGARDALNTENIELEVR